MTGQQSDSARAPAVRLRAIRKTFGSVQALRGVDLDILPGEVHALVGENGAGKSTLGRILAGVVRHDSGTFETNGREVHYRGPREALADGVALLSQETTLVPMRSVVENVFLGREPRTRFGWLRRGAMYDGYRALEERFGYSFDPDVAVGELRIAEQQQVELLRAISLGSRVIVMDEPTAALTANDAQRLLDAVGDLCQRGLSIVYVSHSINEIMRIADRITVLRDGEVRWTGLVREQTHDRLIAAMLGRQLETTTTTSACRTDTEPVLSVQELSIPSVLHGVSLEIRAGEVLGVAGLLGSGQSELAHAIYGAVRGVAGRILLDGREVRHRRPRHAIANGVHLLPQSRRDQGLILDRPVRENITLTHLHSVARGGIVQRRRETKLVAALIDDLQIRLASPDVHCGALSGGNQQKVLFAKLLAQPPKVLMLDEPTRGVDVGAKAAIYRLIADIAANGTAILLISSDLGELLTLSDRIVTMRAGHIVSETDRAHATEDSVMRSAFSPEDAA